MLAHGNQDSTVHFWYTETAEDLQMSGYATKVRELSWNPTSRYLATGGGPAVCVWDCGGTGPAGSRPQMLDGHGETVTLTAVQFQSRGHLLASADDTGRVCVWQPANKKQPLVGTAQGDGEVSVLRWSPDEKLLAVGFSTGSVSVLAVSC
jgi:WD40 repeat protein